MHGLQACSLLLLLHSAFMLSMVKMLLKGEVGGCALNSHRNCIVDHGILWKNHGIVFLIFCGNPVVCLAHLPNKQMKNYDCTLFCISHYIIWPHREKTCL